MTPPLGKHPGKTHQKDIGNHLPHTGKVVIDDHQPWRSRLRTWIKDMFGWRSDTDAEKSAYLRCANFCQQIAFHGQSQYRTARLLLAEEFRNWARDKQ